MHLLIGVRIGLDSMMKCLTGKALQNKPLFFLPLSFIRFRLLCSEWRDGSDSNQMQPIHAGASGLTQTGVIIRKK